MKLIGKGRKSLYPLAFVAGMIAAAGASADALFIEPTDPHDGDEIVLHYPLRGCEGGPVESTVDQREIQLTVNYRGECLYAVPAPGGAWMAGGVPYGTIRLGRLPVGNYRVRLYYRDLARGYSRSASISETFAVMPVR